MNESRKVPALFPLLTVAEIVGLNYETLVAALADGRLRLRAASRKIGGHAQGLVARRDVERFVSTLLGDLEDDARTALLFSRDQRRRLLARLPKVLARMPEGTVAVAEVLKPRTPHRRSGARRAATSSG